MLGIGTGKKNLGSDDELHSCLSGKTEQLRHIEHGRIIGDGHRRHALFQTGCKEFARKDRATLHRVMGVSMKVNKIHGTQSSGHLRVQHYSSSCLIITFHDLLARINIQDFHKPCQCRLQTPTGLPDVKQKPRQ